uniref:Glutathione peroxidase n=1 Tax=Dicentrarchus labrax TaxID=13489 RepID=A0A8C4HR70_DICLA
YLVDLQGLFNISWYIKIMICFQKTLDNKSYGTIYKYHAKTLNGSHTVNFSDYAGKSVLFVNVATY